MISQPQIPAKAWQIHDVLQTLSSALPVDRLDDAIPIHGVVGLLIDLSRQVADAASDSTEWYAVESGPGRAAEKLALRQIVDEIVQQLTRAADAAQAARKLLDDIVAAMDCGQLTHAFVELASQASKTHLEEMADAKNGLNKLSRRLLDVVDEHKGPSCCVDADKYSSRSGT
ncbi:hypothetical protein V4C53_02250 [Paraburkholderia azotifigens]|uniref:hypothetical protein n=1 Tax=Paraburkholderia azotifigens TaxID=2057004 RepID=UPI0031807EA7